MNQRHEFVLKALQPNINFSALCAAHGISRKTGYKWLERFRERGLRGLEDLDRGPVPGRFPLACSAEMALEITNLRKTHPTWGARKLRVVLLRSCLPVDVPSERTINRVLQQAGLSAPRRRKRRRRCSPSEKPTAVALAPNDLWTVDFKGWWRTLSGQKCEPLTLRDDYSRYLLAVELVESPSTELVRGVFINVFDRYGMPAAIKSDNGPPFAATTGVVGLSKLSAWWVALGIRHIRSRPSCPQDNGGHERMHRDLKAELQMKPAWDRRQQQEHCDRWRHVFNEHRPHEAIAMQTPSAVYRRSSKPYPASAPSPVYPAALEVRRVSTAGTVRYAGFQRHVSNALEGYDVGIERFEKQRFRVWFSDLCIGVGKLPWTSPLRPSGSVDSSDLPTSEEEDV